MWIQTDPTSNMMLRNYLFAVASSFLVACSASAISHDNFENSSPQKKCTTQTQCPEHHFCKTNPGQTSGNCQLIGTMRWPETERATKINVALGELKPIPEKERNVKQTRNLLESKQIFSPKLSYHPNNPCPPHYHCRRLEGQRIGTCVAIRTLRDISTQQLMISRNRR